MALNGDRWKGSFSGWDQDISAYRQYMVNHEVGHIFGQRHPKPRCPISGGRSAVMEQQTKGLEGCRGNAWPLGWEIALASQRPLKIAPLPSWQPEPVPTNLGDDPATPTVERTAVASTSVQSTPAPTTIPALSIPPADSADSTPVLVPTPSVPDTPGVPNTAESPSSAKPSTNQSGSPPFIIFAVLALVAATGLAAFVFAGARRFVRQHRRPRPRRQATSMPSGAVDLRAAAFGHPQLSACELTRGVLIAAVILPSSATVIDKSEISALLGRLVQTTVAQIGTDGAWSSGEAVGSLLATVSRDFHVSAGVLAVGKTDLRYSTIGRVGVSIDNRHARRQLLTSEGRLGRLVEPGAAVAALFGGSASTVFRTVLPIQRPDDPGADVQYASLASERKNHPFVIVTRTLESEK